MFSVIVQFSVWCMIMFVSLMTDTLNALASAFDFGETLMVY